MRGVFQAVVSLLMCVVLASALLHIPLFLSDSEEYRGWVTVQIVIHIVGIWLLWHVRRFNADAVVCLLALTLPFVYVNAVYVNYGHGLASFWGALVAWTAFASLVLAARNEFKR